MKGFAQDWWFFKINLKVCLFLIQKAGILHYRPFILSVKE